MQGSDEKYRIVASNPTKNNFKKNSCNSQKSGRNIQDKICVEWEYGREILRMNGWVNYNGGNGWVEANGYDVQRV